MSLEDGSVEVTPDGGHPVTLSVGDEVTVRTTHHAFQLALRGSRRASESVTREMRPTGPELLGETFVIVEDIGVDGHETEVIRVVLGGENANFTRYGIEFRRRSNALIARRPGHEKDLHVFYRFDESWEAPTPVPHRVIRITTKQTRADADLYAACPVIPPE